MLSVLGEGPDVGCNCPSCERVPRDKVHIDQSLRYSASNGWLVDFFSSAELHLPSKKRPSTQKPNQALAGAQLIAAIRSVNRSSDRIEGEQQRRVTTFLAIN